MYPGGLQTAFAFWLEKSYMFLSLSTDLRIEGSLGSQIGLIGSDQFDKLKFEIVLKRT